MPRAPVSQSLPLFPNEDEQRGSVEAGLVGTATAGIAVLVRSMGRASLALALESIAEQSPGSPVEVVLVAASGRRHGPVPERCGPWPIRVVNADGPSLDRAQAANVALAACRSELALFLDDDDRLLPDHLTRLASALADHPEAVAAHAGVASRRPDGAPASPEVVYDEPLDAAEMQMRNQLPIHAVMLRLTAVRREPALQFDEGLPHFEDWDFWLRLMARGPFVRVEGISAIYCLSETTGSGHADASQGRRLGMLAEFGKRQLGRWSPETVAALIERHGQLHAQRLQAEQALDQARRSLDEARRNEATLVVDRDRLAHDRDAWIARLRAAEAEAHRLVDEQLALQHQQRELDARIAELDAHLTAYRREADVLAGVRLELLRTIDVLNARHAAVLASTSWRVTRPLRALGDAWAGARQWLARSRAPRVGRTAGALGVALRAEVRRHGLGGLLRRLPWHLRHWRARLRVLSAVPPTAAPATDVAGTEGPIGLEGIEHAEFEGIDQPLTQRVSVVIPVLNGGSELVLLMRKLRAQRGLGEVEIVIVDSGSTDGSVQAAKAQGATVVQITPAEFTHSHSRNLGADAATGEYLLFMVQDAYPVGDTWLYSMLRWLLAHADQGVVGASCAEYCRSDSDLMYDSMVDTHYRFLGCHEADRIGQLRGQDHMSLRSLGQLSDVACLIDRATFQRYRYRGDYAEDLDLGIRLIRDGHKVAMLSSIRVIHSHNRPAWYYLKRSFVDVIFLVGMFDDFIVPPCASLAGLLDGAVRSAHGLSRWLAEVAERPDGFTWDSLLPARVVRGVDDGPGRGEGDTGVCLGDERLDRYIAGLAEAADSLAGPASRTARNQAAAQFRDAFAARLDHVRQYIVSVYGPPDERLQQQAIQVAVKTYAATLGSALAFAHLQRQRSFSAAEQQWIEAQAQVLKSGV